MTTSQVILDCTITTLGRLIITPTLEWYLGNTLIVSSTNTRERLAVVRHGTYTCQANIVINQINNLTVMGNDTFDLTPQGILFFNLFTVTQSFCLKCLSG